MLFVAGLDPGHYFKGVVDSLPNCRQLWVDMVHGDQNRGETGRLMGGHGVADFLAHSSESLGFEYPGSYFRCKLSVPATLEVDSASQEFFSLFMSYFSKPPDEELSIF